MFHLGVRTGRVPRRPVFPDRLDENGPRQGFFEHGEYEAVRRYLPGPYQDVLDFAYYSGWRKREILDLRWDEVDDLGGVVRLSPDGRRLEWDVCCRSRRRSRRCYHADRRGVVRANLASSRVIRRRCGPGGAPGRRRVDRRACRAASSMIAAGPPREIWSAPAYQNGWRWC